MTSNETSFALLKSIIVVDVGAFVNLSKYIKTVVNLQRNLLIHLVVLLQYNYQKIPVPPIR